MGLTAVETGDARAQPPAYLAESVDKALRLLAAVCERGSVSVSGAGRELGVAPSTAHRLLATLQYHGLVGQDPATRAYVPGQRLLELGLAAGGGLGLRRLARHELETLSAELDETVHLAVLRGARVFFVDSVESSRALRVGSRVGVSLPAHCTAAGKALLATLEPDELDALLGGALEAATSLSIRSREQLAQELARVRLRGFATNVGESEEGLSAVAAVSISLPSERLRREQIDELGLRARRCAAAIEERLP